MAKITLICTQCAIINEAQNQLSPSPKCEECGCTGFLIPYDKKLEEKMKKARISVLERRKIGNNTINRTEKIKKVRGAWQRKTEIERKTFAKDILQPVDRKTGYMNENFNKVYGEEKNPFVGTDRDKRIGGKGLKTV